MSLTPVQYGLLILNLLYRLYSGLFMIIADCDETFNYWEPLNLLLRNFGKQTWEYSPEYKIRSYAYLVPYFILGKVCQFFQFQPATIFFIIRTLGIVGFTCYCEWKLFCSLRRYSASIANWFLLLSTIAPGMSHAGVALLPSSLAMQTTMLGNAFILEAIKSKNHQEKQTSILKATFWYFVGGILGWPFALALGLPLGLYTIYQSVFIGNFPLAILFRVLSVLLTVVIPIMVVDSVFYQKVLFIPINIVLYNVFGGEGEGPEIFGVEPFSYYIMNLLLNFNAIFPLAAVGIFLNPVLTQFKVFSSFVSLQLIIWFAIFFAQPHKEERFLYPVYSLITLLAAILLSKLTIGLKNFALKPIYHVFQLGFILSVVAVSSLRILNLVENYGAPLQTFNALSQLEDLDQPLQSPVNVCMGKEWYHFPASFFLPDSYRLQFVDCGFDGLLPGDFFELTNIIESTTFVPTNMNNKNQFEKDKVIDLDDCHYYVDNSQLNSYPQLIYPNLSTTDKWEVIKCNKMLDPNEKHSTIGKLLYIPRCLRGIIPYDVSYMEFCLLKKQDIKDTV